jgi:hypothetical protein
MARATNPTTKSGIRGSRFDMFLGCLTNEAKRTRRLRLGPLEREVRHGEM